MEIEQHSVEISTGELGNKGGGDKKITQIQTKAQFTRPFETQERQC
jgi:hypothetical protein